MDAWETLIDSSTIETGDAWEHLQAQGGGTVDILELADGLGVTISSDIVSAVVNSDNIEASIKPQNILDCTIDANEVIAKIDSNIIQAEIDNGN